MGKVVLRKGGDKRILKGHLWIFSNEIKEIKGNPKIGDIVEIYQYDGEFFGVGFFNPHSLISVRLLSREKIEIDHNFFKERILSAYKYRKILYPNSETFRLVHGESDFLPGLVIDKYNDLLAVQTFSYGMDLRLNLICDVLEDLFKPTGIVERNESPLRELEGLENRKKILRGDVKDTIFDDDGVKFKIDILSGQKTGFYLDQRENRKVMRRFVKGKKVLDCFTNEGGFALHCAYAGAENVVGVDVSDTAIEKAKVNADLNNLKNVQFEVADVFDKLREYLGKGEKFDVVILDPPSFTKSKRSVKSALSGYREINSTAMKILNPGGILATASCSHHISDEMFMNVIIESSIMARKKIRLIEWRGASPDHPILPSMPETKYLKFGIFQVID
ncbi:23S rRNA (cytosine1962-C5)-methyltransferase [Candidatus Kryptonium thompsonii]|jgi:23S rRNA (cytosine1962-C5)-methyltransferase|uniref:23S rRNA (Cytosine1962-C5)-methyltransferase n=2 Tax=Candidatus Kryptonium thompsonii TaxID=1633631 RepID=A0A0N7MS02_9BACT|nr:class I SAM-dependent rRNA methyltransferase [Candidatus Kryptonium thompsoni]CUS78387.1 23S rRNA (cytosine1962-C5)-methyltransferase [Candidatus Kryptonium thompsoni]CUS85134.1 23S rRNA (cytosine1962-C5)-methyltransferase [Candidatus Kryptonium thompsoni]CUS85930.1 23S rRNA (cytosine1962-C5)-methyltransferase [Candidatus Kryptonium thompsoni]CUS86075.1 23S rRNA (cytosine1962-C5)-methyltransferase [Candidatus Kryptonium thompsoni]CUS89819.1 23S rRNA (cytosine1962-C5)-methyltransferase [Cand